MAANDNFIKQFIAANKKSIDAIKAANPSKKGVGGRKKSAAPAPMLDMMSDEWFETQTQRTQQQLNPNAALGTTAAPMAPPSASKSPIQAPQTGGGIFQGAVAQISYSVQQINASKPQAPSTGGWTPPQIAPLPSPGTPGSKIQFGFQNAAPQAPPRRAGALPISSAAGGWTPPQIAPSSAPPAPPIPPTPVNSGGGASPTPPSNQNGPSAPGGANFRMNRMVHLFKSAFAIGAQGKAEWNPEAQLGPFQAIAQDIAPLLPMPYRIGAYGASLGLGGIMGYWTGRNEKRDAIASQNAARMNMNDPNMSAQIHRDSQGNRNMWRSRTSWEKWMHFVGGSTPYKEASQDEAERTAALMGMRSNGYLYGGKASKAVVQYASKNKIPIGSMSDRSVNEIVDAVSDFERRKLAKTPQFQKALQGRLPFDLGYGIDGYWGRDKQDTKDELEQHFLNAIESNPSEAAKFGFPVPKYTRENKDRRIEKYLKDNEPTLHKLKEENKMVELTAKAERHRHLAEF